MTKVIYKNASMGNCGPYIHYDVSGDLIVGSALVSSGIDDGFYTLTLFTHDGEVHVRRAVPCDPCGSVEDVILEKLAYHGMVDLEGV